MCSAASLPEPSAGDTTAARLIDTACGLIAESGVRATSVRAVARAAGVSAPLVIHHFGSKAGLVAACDSRVCDAVDATLEVFRDGGKPDDLAGSWVELLASTPYLAYVTQSLREGGGAGAHLFDLLYRMSRDVDREMRSDGVARPTADPEMRALLLMSLDLGMLLLADHVERVLGAPLDSPEMGERWVLGALEILTGGVLAGSFNSGAESTNPVSPPSDDQPKEPT